ncbi:hypothetical protein Tco_0288909, partial [Tanacetum coccineum]
MLLGLVPQGQKASDYDNSDPVPPRQNVVPSAEKTDSSQQGLEFLFSPLLEEYYNPTHGLTEENKTVLKQLKKANASLTQELKECKTNLNETSRALGEATISRDSCLIALQTKQTELE